MATNNRLIRLFISSTFSDMGHERRLLHEQVFPLLGEFCRSRGAEFQPVDLRWGVNESDQLDHKTMDICLGEIERCQRLSPKPNFLVLLGDRYGWEPVPARIAAAEFERLYAVASQEERVLLDRWYSLDLNAVPPEYYLLPREDAFADYSVWEHVEGQLRDILRRLVISAGIAPVESAKYFQSATHQEIVCGALGVLPDGNTSEIDPSEHVLACFRTINGLPSSDNAFHDNRSEQITELKERIRLRLGDDNVYEYESEWLANDQEDIRLDDQAAFVLRVCDHFEALIESQLSDDAEIDPLESEIEGHRRFRDERCRHFFGRKDEIKAIEDYLCNDDDRVLNVIGAGGSGKSALMAEVSRRLEDKPGILIYRFVGATPLSTAYDVMLQMIFVQLCRKLHVEVCVPREFADYGDYFSDLLGCADPEHPIVIIIDGVDQLILSRPRMLDWVPLSLPANVKMVFSSVRGLGAMPREAKSLNISPFEKSDGELLLNTLLGDCGRCLQDGQRTLVMNAFAVEGLPLFIKIAAEMARDWRSASEPEPLPTSLEQLIESMLYKLETTHTPRKGDAKAPFVETVLGLLASASYGLSETELLDIISKSSFMGLFKQTTYHNLTKDDLPIAVWSRLYRAIDPYLSEQSAQNKRLLFFFHRIFHEVIKSRYCQGALGRNWHSELASYFCDQPTYLDEARKLPNARKLAELVCHQVLSGAWEDLERTLTDFDFLMGAFRAGFKRILINDYRVAWNKLEQNGCRNIRIWAGFFRSNSHIFRRFNKNKRVAGAMLQLAFEHADDSPVSAAAERWINDGNWSQLWLRKAHRPKNYKTNPCVAVLEGTETPEAVIELSCGRILTWNISESGGLYLWHKDGTLINLLRGHNTNVHKTSADDVEGVLQLPASRFLSWSGSNEIIIWSEDGEKIKQLDEHQDSIHGCVVLSDNILLSWDAGGITRLWNLATLCELSCVTGIPTFMNGSAFGADGKEIGCVAAYPYISDLSPCENYFPDGLPTKNIHDGRGSEKTILSDGKSVCIRTCSRNGHEYYQLVFVDNEGIAESVLYEQPEDILGSLEISEHRFISWGYEGLLRVWSFDGELLATIDSRIICGAQILSDGLIVTTGYNCLKIWDLSNEAGKWDEVEPSEMPDLIDAFEIADGNVVSWSFACEVDPTLVIWDRQNNIPKRVVPHKVFGGRDLGLRRFLTWSSDGIITLWDYEGNVLKSWEGHKARVLDCIQLKSGNLFSLADDNSLKIWTLDGSLITLLACAIKDICSITETISGNLLVNSENNGACLFSSSGFLILEIAADNQLFELDCGRLVSWKKNEFLGEMPDYQIKLLSSSGNMIAVLDGHSGTINGASALYDGRILTWSYDGSVRLWAKDGSLLYVWEGNGHPVKGAKESPDGRGFVSWSWYGEQIPYVGDDTKEFMNWSEDEGYIKSYSCSEVLSMDRDLRCKCGIPNSLSYLENHGDFLVVYTHDMEGEDLREIMVWASSENIDKVFFNNNEIVVLSGGRLQVLHYYYENKKISLKIAEGIANIESIKSQYENIKLLLKSDPSCWQEAFSECEMHLAEVTQVMNQSDMPSDLSLAG